MTTRGISGESFPHLHREVQALAGADAATRIASVHRDLWIPYERARDIEQRLADLLAHPPSHRMPNLLIIGEGGHGKSSIAKHFAKRQAGPGMEVEARSHVPVLLLESPSEPREVLIYQEILRTLFSPFHPKAPVGHLRHQVERTLDAIGTRMLIFDELHHLLDGSSIKQRQCLNAIKSLANTLRVALVGVGTARAERVIATDRQLASRFEVLELPAWRYGAPWRELLATFERRLPLRRPSGLADPPIARLLHERSGGRLGDLVLQLRGVAKNAITTEVEQITLASIESFVLRHPGEP